MESHIGTCSTETIVRAGFMGLYTSFSYGQLFFTIRPPCFSIFIYLFCINKHYTSVT